MSNLAATRLYITGFRMASRKADLSVGYAESIEYLYSIGNEILSMKLGLDAIRELCGELGNPQERFPAIHIAGTNGKGSTAAMVESVLRAAGIRTGIYISPHLVSITERIRVDGEMIPPEDFARLATRVRTAGERLHREGRVRTIPTFFEQITAIGYLWLAEQQVELAVLEVGMGGRLDATNICHPVVTAITPVGLDHQQYLGSTIAAIAGEKAGIIKPGIPVVVAPQEAAARAVIAARATELDAPLIEGEVTSELVGRRPDLRQCATFHAPSGRYTLEMALRGDHQRLNAATAISIVDLLRHQGWKIGAEAVVTGLEKTCWPGRLDLRTGPAGLPFLIDGAHNIAGVEVLSDFLIDYCAGRPLSLIFGAMRDKDLTAMTRRLFPLFAQVILTGIDSPRALDPAEIDAPSGVERVAHLPAALELAARLTPPEGLVVVAGSLYLAGEVLAHLG